MNWKYFAFIGMCVGIVAVAALVGQTNPGTLTSNLLIAFAAIAGPLGLLMLLVPFTNAPEPHAPPKPLLVETSGYKDSKPEVEKADAEKPPDAKALARTLTQADIRKVAQQEAILAAFAGASWRGVVNPRSHLGRPNQSLSKVKQAALFKDEASLDANLEVINKAIEQAARSPEDKPRG